MSGLAPVSWGESIAQRLLDDRLCPVCQGPLEGGCCPRCGADLRGPAGADVWDASEEAAAAVRRREALLARVPTLIIAPVGPSSAPPVGARGGAAGARSAAKDAEPSDPQRSATLQSVLATAGAGLFAVSALVFTYANPDLTDRALRSVIVGLITLLFLGGAWLLSRRGLRYSAEAVGGLGLVFAALDVHAVAQLAAPEIDAWATAAAATALGGAVMLSAGRRLGLRVWEWTAIIALALSPGMLGLAGGTALTVAFGAIGMMAVAEILRIRLRPEWLERASLTALQFVAALSAIVQATAGDLGEGWGATLTRSGLLLMVAVAAVFAARGMLSVVWAFCAGVLGSLAIVLASWSLVGIVTAPWLYTLLPGAAAIALVVTAVVPIPRGVPRTAVAGGSLALLALPVVLLSGMAVLTGLLTLSAAQSDGFSTTVPRTSGWGVPVGLLALAAGLALFATWGRGREIAARLLVIARRSAPILAAVAVLVVGAGALLITPAAIAVLTVPVIVAAAALLLLPALAAPRFARGLLIVTAHIALLAAVLVAWTDRPSVSVAGIATLVALAALAAATPARWRFLQAGIGFGYALVLIANALSQAGVTGTAQLCLTASAGLVVAIAVTYLRPIGARSWQAVLVVSVVPFAIGVLQVVVERSGWTALSTGVMVVLAVSLLLTRRPGLTLAVRTLAAAMLVPAIAVVIVCLGAQLLASSGSPVVLPIIAVLVALALPSTPLIRGMLRARGLPDVAADAARVAIEISSLLTGLIAVGLALGREAAGAGTSFLVLLILGFGAVATALFAGRRYAWAVAGASFTGALWCVWALTGVDLLEAYLLPPTIGAAAIAALLTLRGHRATGLFSAGLLIAIAPLLAIIAVSEPSARGEGVWRVAGLLLAAWLLLLGDAVMSRARGRGRRLRALRLPALAAVGLAATAGTIQAVRIGRGLDLPELTGAGLFLTCIGVGALGAAALLVAARRARAAAEGIPALRATRWLEAPAALALALGAWCAIERDWFTIWAMWGLMLGYLVGVVVVARAVTRRETTLPPVWFLFGIAFITAIVAWSPRDLRVEWFSLPLGAFLLVAGIIGMRATAPSGARGRSLDSWPGRWSGSWALLAPGIVTMMIASIVSTFTDPLTWRAILVMVLALGAILVGSRRRLAAPFLLGMLVLPIENVFVFAVQIGRGIESMPWWITLAVMGAVLLIIAVTAERRTGEGGSVAARIRDLR